MRIIYRNNEGVLMEVTWKTGTPSPFRDAPTLVWNVGEVTATGPELDYIRVNFERIPMVQGDRAIWYGDDAKFIAGNLPQ